MPICRELNFFAKNVFLSFYSPFFFLCIGHILIRLFRHPFDNLPLPLLYTIFPANARALKNLPAKSNKIFPLAEVCPKKKQIRKMPKNVLTNAFICDIINIKYKGSQVTRQQDNKTTRSQTRKPTLRSDNVIMRQCDNATKQQCDKRNICRISGRKRVWIYDTL